MGLVVSRGHSLGMIVASSLSIFGSSTILLAFLLFPKLRNKSTYEAIFYIAISNLLTSIGSLMGYPIDGSPACWIEGIGTNIFTLSSIFWNVVVNYIIFCIVKSKPIQITTKIHCICWGLSVLVTLLPLINVTYGAPDGFGWCFVVPKDNSPSWALMFWYWASYYFWVWICVLVSISMFIMIYYLGKSNMEGTKTVINNIVFKLMFYPPIIIICWGMTTVHDTIYMINSNLPTSFAGADQYYYMVDVLPCLQGALTAIVFWSTMPSIRKVCISYIRYGYNNGLTNGSGKLRSSGSGSGSSSPKYKSKRVVPTYSVSTGISPNSISNRANIQLSPIDSESVQLNLVIKKI